MYNNSINPHYQLIISFFINPGYWPDKPSFSRNYDYRSIKHRYSDNHSYGTNYASFRDSIVRHNNIESVIPKTKYSIITR